MKEFFTPPTLENFENITKVKMNSAYSEVIAQEDKRERERESNNEQRF
jgi:hypothetical protein